MPTSTIPNIFFKGWFWCIFAITLLIIVHFLKKKSPPPFQNVKIFFTQHKVTITKISDVILISLIIFSFFILIPNTQNTSNILFYNNSTRAEFEKIDLLISLQFMILWSGFSGVLFGGISIFHSNLTIIKRVILLIVCLLPVVFTILSWLIDKISLGPNLQLCLYSSTLSWLANATAIFAGKHFSHVLEGIDKKIKLFFRSLSV